MKEQSFTTGGTWRLGSTLQGKGARQNLEGCMASSCWCLHHTWVLSRSSTRNVTYNEPGNWRLNAACSRKPLQQRLTSMDGEQRFLTNRRLSASSVHGDTRVAIADTVLPRPELAQNWNGSVSINFVNVKHNNGFLYQTVAVSRAESLQRCSCATAPCPTPGCTVVRRAPGLR